MADNKNIRQTFEETLADGVSFVMEQTKHMTRMSICADLLAYSMENHTSTITIDDAIALIRSKMV